MKSESPALAILAAHCRKVAESSSTNAEMAGQAFDLFREWAVLVARSQHPVSPEERQKIDVDAESLFNRMKDFVSLHLSDLALR